MSARIPPWVAALASTSLFLWPGLAHGRPGSPLAVGDDLHVGAELVFAFGSLPRTAAGVPGAEWTSAAVFAQLQSSVGGWSRWSAHGAQLGLEYTLRLGVTPEQAELAGVERPPLLFTAALSPVLRVYTFDLPAPGMVVVLLGLEGSLGGGYWWSNNPRLTPLLGVRFAIGEPAGLRCELEYVLAPYTIGASFEERSVVHTEHRASLSAGLGPIGVGLTMTAADDLVNRGAAAFLDGDRTGSYSLGVALEWRGE